MPVRNMHERMPEIMAEENKSPSSAAPGAARPRARQDDFDMEIVSLGDSIQARSSSIRFQIKFSYSCGIGRAVPTIPKQDLLTGKT